MKEKTMRDQELDQILSPLQANFTNDLQLSKWRQAVREELSRPEPQSKWKRFSWVNQIAAGIVIGLVISSIFNLNTTHQQTTQSNATVEYIYANSN